MPRTIFHIDLDAFFVAVERVRDPSLIGRPVVVGGLGTRGVVSTASYEARKFGVHSAMPMGQARRLCPQAAYLPVDFDRYLAVSRQFRAVIDTFSPIVEQTSVDEAYADMTGTERLFGPPIEAARKMKQRVLDEAKVTASIGIASNKVVAKVATNESKPDGLLYVPPGHEALFLAPLPVRKLPGLGPKTQEVMQRLGIGTLGELAGYPADRLRREVGPHSAEWLATRASGLDDGPVVTDWEAKSISNEVTFEKDVSAIQELMDMLLGLSEKVGSRLRKSGKKARNIQIRLRYADFSTISRQCTMSAPVDGDAAIYGEAKRLLEAALKQRQHPVRLIGVGVTGLDGGADSGEAVQLAMLEAVPELNTDSKVSTTMDAIRERFGDEAIKRGNAAQVRRSIAPFVRPMG
ncbi:MAG: DNA polymerase IV [Dehalococcoidia bacterium]|nr:DNA polymerase IV [Dehalococcoidia bacterium]